MNFVRKKAINLVWKPRQFSTLTNKLVCNSKYILNYNSSISIHTNTKFSLKMDVEHVRQIFGDRCCIDEETAKSGGAARGAAAPGAKSKSGDGVPQPASGVFVKYTPTCAGFERPNFREGEGDLFKENQIKY
jgi:hypothetical protein